MADWLRNIKGALFFQRAAFERLSEHSQAFWQGLLVVLLVGLLASLPAFVIQTVRRVTMSPSVEISMVFRELNTALDQMEPFLQQMPTDVREQFMAGMRQGFEMAERIGHEVVDVPTALPQPLPRLLEAFGAWISTPFASPSLPLTAATLATWMGYGVWVLLAARLLGGRGNTGSFFGLTGFYAAPHVLGMLNLVPYLGSLAGLVAFFWGAAIYVRAVSVSQKISIERALLALLLPVLVMGFVLVVVAFFMVGMIVLSAAGASS